MKQDILIKIDIHDYIGKFVALQQKGRDQYFGLCPFHHEKTPSFSVSMEKKFFHCFGCKASGDVIKFVMLYDNLEYDQAIRKLALEAGIKLTDKTCSTNSYNVYVEINSKFAQICHLLLKDKSYHYGIDYLMSRQLQYEMLDRFQLGYLPANKSEEVFKELSSTFAQEAIFESGLFKLGIGEKPYCQFNGRIIYPIADTNNKIVGFGSRVITGEGKPKYLNSADSDFFHKSELLYGLNKLYGDKKLKETKTIFVVEGYMDVISLANHGITNCVGVLGANLAANQLQKLWKFTDRPTVCFDNDAAGAAAMERVSKIAVKIIEPGKSVCFLKLQGCKDPDEFIKKYGADHFLQYFSENKISLADYIYNSESNRFSLTDPDEVVALRQLLGKICDDIANDILRNEYKKHFNKLFYNKRIFKDEFKKNTISKHDINALKPLHEVDNNEEKICKMISQNSFLLMDQEILDDFMDCKFKSDVAEKMRLDLTKNIDQQYVAAQNAEVYKIVKSLIISLKIRDVQDAIISLCKQDMSDKVESQLLQLKKYEIQLKNKLSSTLI